MDTKEVKTKKCSRCGRILSTDNFYRDNRTKDRLYCDCKECHSKIVNKNFTNKFTGYYVYIIQDKNNEIVYVGKTTNYYKRLSHHISGYVDSTKELFDNGDWGIIKYLDVSDLVANEMELKVLENMLIGIYEPKLNKAKNIIRDVDNDRIFTLIATLHNMSQDWKIFKVNK